MKTILLALLCALTYNTTAQKHPAVTIPGTQLRHLSSKIVKGQDYELHINLPRGYSTSQKKYPVIYLLDSQWDFPLVSAIYGEQFYDGFVPEVILVGIASSKDGKVFRSRDYTPTQMGDDADTGKADDFLKFMSTELFPFIENNYNASQKRTLMGCSLGGLFTLYTLFTHTEMFDNYVAASPAIHWDNSVLYTYEKSFNKTISKPLSLYMTVGDVETGRSNFKKFAAFISKKYNNNPNLRLSSKVLENTGHSGSKSETYARGLQHAFERKKLQLSPTVLKKYVGHYKLDDNVDVNIQIKNGSLFISSNQGNVRLFAQTEHHFYATFQFFNIYFKDSKNQPESFELETFDNTLTFKKAK